MTSRLDRLFVLLEAGTGAATRRAAARQLGEIQKAHPEELQRLLGRLTKHLRSPAWETRVAAAQAVEAILANVPEWHPSPLAVAKDEKVEEATARLSCESLDIESVLRHGAHLMGSEGRQYVLEELPPGANDTKERLARQRRQLNAQLGLDVAASLGLDLGAVYSNEDLCPATPEPEPSTSKGLAGKFEVPRRPVLELVPLSKGLSSREMNLAKRKARHQLTKQKSQERPPSPQPEPERKKAKVETDELDLESSPAPESSGSWAPSARWPLEAWCGALQSQLFDAAWEARHGAASALRELLRARVSSTAGHQAHMTEEQMEQAHQEWLEDMALRLLCVLALDRFGDFVSDQVVAPVRESCAQTLGVALAVLSESRVGQVARLLSRLGAQPQWECRHGALLGFKYLLAARPEVAVSHGALEHLMAGVGDAAEDVAAVAAGALVPAAAALATARPQALPLLVTRLLQLLRDQDELAAPANSYLALLAALMALPQAAKLLHPVDLSDVLPRLWPYLDHSTSSVRKATLQTLRTLTRPLVTDSTNTNGDVTAKHEEGQTGGNGMVQAENGGKNGGNVGKISESGEKICDNSNLESNIKSNGLEINTKSNGQIHADNKINCNEIKSSDAQANFSDVKQSNNGASEVKSNSVSEEDDESKLNWTPELLQEAMRHVYQRILFEHVHEIQEIALQVWRNLVTHSRLPTLLMAACPGLAGWLCLAMQPARLPLEPHLILRAQPHSKERRTRTNSQSESDPPEARPSQKWFVGGSESQPAAARDRNVMRARCLAARALGLLSCYLVQPAPGIEYATDQESPIDYYVKVMVVYLKAGSALQRLVAALVVAEWARHTADSGLFPPSTGGQNGTVARDIGRLAPPLLVSTLHCALNQSLYYDEVALNCNRVLQEARDLVAMMKHYKLPVPEQFNNIIRLEQVFEMTLVTEPMVGAVKVKRVSSSLEERRRSLHAAAAQCTQEQNALHVAVQAALAGACANLHAVPEKLNPVVRPLMESIKREASEELQALAASTLSELLGQLVGREPCPNNKVLANLKAFLRCDPEYTPRICPETTPEADSGSDSGESNAGRNTSHMPHLDKCSGILTLWEQQRQAERSAPRRGRPPAQASLASAAIDQVLLNEDEGRKLLRIQRRGATLALTRLTAHYGDRLPEALPKLWEFIIQPLEKVPTDQELEQTEAEPAEELISRLQVLEVVCSHIGPALWPRVVAGVGALASLTRAALTAVRHMAARCLAAMATRDPLAVMHTVIDELVPLLSCGAACSPTERARCGAAEALSRVVDALQLGIVPYIVLLVIPLLGRMSDQCCAVRVMSTRCFASLIQLMPLDGAVPEPAGLAPELKARRVKDRRFLEQLFNPKSIKDYKVPVPVNAELRSYQQAGVNWLRFLNEYKLHGVLCDDMGLGKTLQSIVVLSGSHWERRQEGLPERPSLVVCPPTLTGHWVFEVNKFIPSQFLRPLQYVGPPLERERLRQTVHHYNLIVASYDIVRKDIEFFSAIRWHYCVLDEGHVIKNGRTKAFQAIRQLVANHRLILSGTPIQNNVLELWSLFDFLMPGLLGTEREFTARYSRPILAARDPKATPHQLQSGALACEALHRQVLPFLLRRVKEDVLKELPPKITQDYYCELSPLQRRLYEHFARHHLPDTEHQASHTHVFQALHYLQSVCNHPKLVLTPEHPEAAAVAQQLQRQGSTLDHIDHSAKLPALKQLLLDCGIGVPSDCESEVVVSQHRALIFCQLKKMLDIVEKDLLQRHLPTVTYLRLDGSVPAHQRHAIVTRFNNDVSIDVLLLTTQVGGLGLNLTGADTVIFVEHDWNPMKDLQAMDRAHRIGQRRVVNVYRLITRDTLEEKIMGLQKFKLQTANTVISSENASLQTMGTDQLLDLFQISKPQQPGSTQPSASGSTAPPLESLPDLWDDKQYEEEYDMSSFIRSLHTMNNS